jgi:putative FmdB family regulatory protein
MPIYEYKCKDCENISEHYIKIRDEQPKFNCALCGGACKKIISKLGMIDMNPGPLSGVDDTDELTLGKIIANKGMPAEHKRQYAAIREKRKEVAEYEKGLKERAKKFNFDPEEA